MKSVFGARSWVLSNNAVELAITEHGGMMAPVTFYPGTDHEIQPYFVSPWQEEQVEIEEPVLRTLRGDFFCFPFGENNALGGENHPVHGETAGSAWTLASQRRDGPVTALELSLATTIRPGTVTKSISLIDGQSCVYLQHRLLGQSGPTSLGHHATLRPPTMEAGMLISTSDIAFGMVAPRDERYTSGGEYYALEPAAVFETLERVPTVWRDDATADCSRFPRRKGFVDILAVAVADTTVPAWTVAVVPSEGYLWFALRDPKVLPITVLWMENHGRHGDPWNGRTCCIGLEDVCGYLATGLGPSAQPNELSRRGVPTVVELDAHQPMVVNYIQGIASVPPDFGKVRELAFTEGGVRFSDIEGKSVDSPVHHAFLSTGTLKV